MRAIAVAAAVLAVALGCVGCRDDASTGPSQPQNELTGIQTTLDAIESEVAGDGSP